MSYIKFDDIINLELGGKWYTFPLSFTFQIKVVKNTSSMHQHVNGWSAFHRLEKESNSQHTKLYLFLFVLWCDCDLKKIKFFKNINLNIFLIKIIIGIYVQ
jgi:hypothetical protein